VGDAELIKEVEPTKERLENKYIKEPQYIFQSNLKKISKTTVIS
jgi:hypothetical protein